MHDHLRTSFRDRTCPTLSAECQRVRAALSSWKITPSSRSSEAAGRHFVECPLTGGAPGAQPRMLVFMVGGEAARAGGRWGNGRASG